MAAMAMTFTHTPNPSPASADRIAEIHANPGFGKFFTDHMVKAVWRTGEGWGPAEVVPYGPIQLDPASAVLHYAQEIFEGMKAYRHADGSVWTFRPQANAARFNRSATRLALPHIPEADFVRSLEELVRIDQHWVPTPGGDSGTAESSLYLRPFMFGSESFLGVRAAQEVTYMVIACPVGPYFAGGLKPVSIWQSTTYTRAAPGGTGAAKCGGNYAAGLAAQAEGAEHGCDQVVFLDAEEHKYIEELGGMNLYFVHADGTLVTPETSGTILEGVTRSSLLEVAKDLGLSPVERRISIDEWKDGVASGAIREVFACGTAAVITPVGRLVWEGGEVGSMETGEMTSQLRARLIDIQYGRAADSRGWLHRLV
jgi:branched-chain amino acid aminotransferase